VADEPLLLAALDAVDCDPDPRVRTAALGALVRSGDRRARSAWRAATTDAAPEIRRRSAELAPALGDPAPTLLVDLLEDTDGLVAEAAAWACGEVQWRSRDRPRIVAALIVAAAHTDPLVREAAVAALGAIGDPAGLPAVLAGCEDRPAVRRRAVLALAPFTGPEVDAALAKAQADRDWQVRQAAEDLEVPGPADPEGRGVSGDDA
jgi:HEAT repeat protein